MCGMESTSQFPDDKRPRHYSAEILDLPRAERSAALASVPDHLRNWVRGYIEDHFAKRGALASYRKRRTQEPFYAKN
jgi:hypothetical protein